MNDGFLVNGNVAFSMKNDPLIPHAHILLCFVGSFFFVIMALIYARFCADRLLKNVEFALSFAFMLYELRETLDLFLLMWSGLKLFTHVNITLCILSMNTPSTPIKSSLIDHSILSSK